MEELKFSEYIEKCLDFEKNPEDQTKIEEIKNFLDKIEVKEYLPMKEKELIMMNILDTLHQDYDAPGAAMILEHGKVIYGLLGYCVNLDNDLPIINYNYFCVDAIYKYGLYDTVISYCEKDYNRFLKMLDETINFTNIYRITQTAALFNEEAYENWKKGIQDLKDSLNSEDIKSFLEIVDAENEDIKDLVTSLQDLALNQANKETEQESSKFDAAAEFLEKTKENSEDEQEDKNKEKVVN
ncbi:MAG: hypothetical protein J6T10_04525 [Methanobrevibacter sp.]|nr:hypothetical protein [Methanobrevibacter sp.]